MYLRDERPVSERFRGVVGEAGIGMHLFEVAQISPHESRLNRRATDPFAVPAAWTMLGPGRPTLLRPSYLGRIVLLHSPDDTDVSLVLVRSR